MTDEPDAIEIVPSPSNELAPVAVRARAYAAAARSEATRRAYSLQWRTFVAWCKAREFPSMPAPGPVVALYLTDRADGGASVATMAQALAAISVMHGMAGEPSPRTLPEVREVWQGIRRTKGVGQRQARALSVAELRRLVQVGKGLRGLRDQALLLIGFAGALRRSELVALDAADIAEDSDGLVIHVRRSKTDQEGQGRKVGVPFGSDRATCPVRSLKAWLEAAGVVSGAIFVGVGKGDRVTGKRLSGGDVSRVLRRAAKRARISLDRLSGHSLRAGLATAAAKAGKPAHVIQRQTGHRSIVMVQRYIRDGELFDGNAASGIGL